MASFVRLYTISMHDPYAANDRPEFWAVQMGDEGKAGVLVCS